jgi:hypothetical protein
MFGWTSEIAVSLRPKGASSASSLPGQLLEYIKERMPTGSAVSMPT